MVPSSTNKGKWHCDKRLAMSKNDILNVWIKQSLHDVDSLPVNTIKVIGSLNAI